MANQLNAVIIGCGRMGAFTSPSVRTFESECWFPLSHAEAILAHPRLRLVALCDSQPEVVARAGDVYGVPSRYTDPQQLLYEVQPSLLGIATRTVGRAAIIEAAIAVGTRALHVEKPLCNSMRELQALDALLSREDVFLTYGALRRLLHPYKAARDFIVSGALGELLEVQVNMGRGQLFWAHPHGVDALLFAAGGRRVEAVTGRLANVERGTNRCEIVSDPWVESATVLFAGGLEGRITRTPGFDLVFACERGALTVESNGRQISLYEQRGDDLYPRRYPWKLPAAPKGEGGTLAAMALLVNCLEGNEAARAVDTAVKRDIVVGQRLLFAIAQSNAEGGRAVAPEEVDPDSVIWARSGSKYA